MTFTPTDAEAMAVAKACAQVGLDGSPATPLHRHATSVWLLHSARIVVRLTGAAADQPAIARAVSITRWLTKLGYPATEPIDVDQPVDVDDTTVTFWRYYPQHPTPPDARALGELLRRLHALPAPPVPLEDYVPLQGLGELLSTTPDPLTETDRTWLQQRRVELLASYGELDSVLGVGWIHGDAYPGNTLWDGDLVRLGDWEEVARGPRELDLVSTHQGARVGRPAAERQAFTDAYGWDVTTWPGYPILREIRDLHTLGAYIRRAAHDPVAAAELRHRVATLRADDADARWNIR